MKLLCSLLNRSYDRKQYGINVLSVRFAVFPGEFFPAFAETRCINDVFDITKESEFIASAAVNMLGLLQLTLQA